VSISSVVVAWDGPENDNELAYNQFKNNKTLRILSPHPAKRIEALITPDYSGLMIWLNSSPQSKVSLSPRDSSGKKYGPHLAGDHYKGHHLVYNFQINKLYIRHTAGTAIEDKWIADCHRNYDYEPVRFLPDGPPHGYWYICLFPFDKDFILYI